MNMKLQCGRRDRKIIKNSLGKPLGIRLFLPFFWAPEFCLKTSGRTSWLRAGPEARSLPNRAELELKKGTVYIQASRGIRTSYPGVRDAEDSKSFKECRFVIDNMALGRQQYVMFMGGG
jgi:hypothetical protein